MRFKNKVVMITGSSSGIGYATALKFAQEGASLILNSRKNVEGGNKLLDEVSKLGAKAIYIQADVSQPDEVKHLFTEATKQFEYIDILLNNAGSTVGAPFLETTKQHWLQSMEGNLITAVLCSIEAAKIMKQRGGGKIINTASVRGLEHTGREGLMSYSAAKAAVINFTKTLAKELAPTITVNAVAPGFVYTTNYDKMAQEVKDKFIANTPLGRFINADEIADAYLYLASTDVVTGEVLVVDGGFTLKLS